MNSEIYDFLVIGGGAAGVFAAILAAEKAPHLRIAIVEATGELMTKIKISGGGRCNVTHNESIPGELVKAYPRGNKELRGPFSVFSPKDMLAWLEENGVETHAEVDGRIFPKTNQSKTITYLFNQKLESLNIPVFDRNRITEIQKSDELFIAKNQKGTEFHSKKLLIASGSSKKMYELIGSLGHTIIEPVPSLFTFNTKDRRLADLLGVSFDEVDLTLTVNKRKFKQTGPLLITHWGLSGPAVIKLSAWAARQLEENNYKAELQINFCSSKNQEEVREQLSQLFEENAKKKLSNVTLAQIPKRYWKSLLTYLDISQEKLCCEVSKKNKNQLIEQIASNQFQITGKGEFKDEFVTAGGVKLKEVNFKTMESKQIPGLHFAGEVLNIDGITGGFNFQNAWTTAYITATSISE